MELLATGWLGAAFAATLGAAVGSFSNVVIFRSPREGLSSFRPARSFCPSCSAQLAWHDNIPLLSWLWLGGRCRACRAPIGLRYPSVELLVAALFLVAWRLLPPVDAAGTARLLAAWYLASACVVVSLIDLEHCIIPDSITLPGTALGLAASAAFPALQAGHPGFSEEAPRVSALVASALGALAGGGSLAIVGQVGNVLLKRRIREAGVQDAMGWGDVKWMALAGSFLGAAHVLGAILLACFVGAAAGILLMLFARLRGQAAPPGLPFGPYLSVGILVELAAPGQAFRWLEALAVPA